MRLWHGLGTVTVVAVCVLGGCASRSAPAASPPPSSTTTTTTTVADTTPYVCGQLNTAAYTRSLAELTAIAGDDGYPEIRRGVAAAYAAFANELSQITMQANSEFRPVLADWTAASNEVASYISGSNPGPDLVVDFGPSFPRWQAAEKAAETVCGHELPEF
jgi:hypothetical protein